MENVANDASVRSIMLDDRPDLLMGRFMQMADMNDTNLHLAVAKALYTISCAHENISKMADHNILILIKKLWESREDDSIETSDNTDFKKNSARGTLVRTPSGLPAGSFGISRQESGIPVGLDHLLVACLYNLSTYPPSQNKLVSNGFIELIISMWEMAKKSDRICYLACYSVFHMACGLTSSAR